VSGAAEAPNRFRIAACRFRDGIGRAAGKERAMIAIRHEKNADAAAREVLLDAAYGPVRFTKPSARLRGDRAPARGLSFVATEDGRIVGTVRLWDVTAGPNRPALLLGPLVVDPTVRNRGVGAALMRRALDEAKRRGHRAVLLVGDPAYYGRFGFSAERTGGLWLPGLDDKSRLLGCELAPAALDGARGTVRAPQPTRRPLVATVPALPAPRAA
jgi:predicted N-acetyltransferase YhbS